MIPRPSRLVLLGHPVRHSLSPRFQAAALRSAGVPLEYEALDVPAEELDARVAALIAERAAGNATIPHKEHLYALGVQRSAVAERAGAANTFWVDGDGRLAVDNTDVGGFAALVERTAGDVAGSRIAVLGAGGAAAAALTAIERWAGCTVTLCARGAARRDRLAARFSVVRDTADRPDHAVRGCAVVVNATPVGLADGALPVPVEALDPDSVVIDLVYRPGETAWVLAARAAGHVAADGLAMLIEQGALAFERWLGIPAPREVMWRAVREG